MNCVQFIKTFYNVDVRWPSCTYHVAKAQGYLGRCYVTIKQHEESLGQLSKTDWSEFADICRRLEDGVKKAFGARVTNWACLINNAFQEDEVLPHVHWHFRPRYDSDTIIDGVIFKDPLFGHHYDRDQRMFVTERVHKKILTKLEQSL